MCDTRRSQEFYPRQSNRKPVPSGWTSDQHDAFTVAEWLREADRDGRLGPCLAPGLCDADRKTARIEGWILGVGGREQPTRAREGLARSAQPCLPHAGLLFFDAGADRAPSTGVPEIARFLGIVIGMFYTEHGRPHFHDRHGELQVSVEIETGIVRGVFPGSVLELVLDWADLHRAELLDNWDLARRRVPLKPVEPLR